MPSSVEQIYKQVMRLPEKAREELTVRLIKRMMPDTADELSKEWGEELQRRFEDLRSGRVKGLSKEEFFRAIMDDVDDASRS